MSVPDLTIHTLSNGLRLIHKRVSGTRLVHCGYIINAGSRDDDSLPGIAHCLEHMVFKGTEKRRTIHVLNHLEVVGAEMNAFTTKEITAVYATVQGTHFSRAADILSDVVFHSTIPEVELTKEKQVIAEEIRMYLDTPEENIYDEFQEMVFEGHPLAHNILGTENTLAQTGRNDILDFVKTWYRPDNMVFSVVGNISLQRAIAALEKYTAHIPAATLAKTRSIPADLQYQVRHQEKQTEYMQAYGIIGCPSYHDSHKDRWKMTLLNNLLGGPGLNSRLNLAIREKYGFTYQIESGYQAYLDNGMFHCYLGAENKHLQRSLELVKKELKLLREKKLGSLQLQRFVNQFCGQMVMADENRSGLMVHIGKGILTHGSVKSLEEIIKEIRSITASDILETANAMFEEKNLSSLTYIPS